MKQDKKQKTLIENLRSELARKGISARALSLASDLSESTVKDILSGKVKNPRHDTLAALANELGTSVGKLTGEQGGMGEPDTPFRHNLIEQNKDNGRDENYVSVPFYDVDASAGHGALTSVERNQFTRMQIFSTDWLKTITSSPVEQLAVINIRGESMEPTLHNGDMVMVDFSQRSLAADGIYVMAMGDELVVKRVTPHPVNGTVAVSADNQLYSSYEGISPEDLHVAGRVIWISRAIA